MNNKYDSYLHPDMFGGSDEESHYCAQTKAESLIKKQTYVYKNDWYEKEKQPAICSKCKSFCVNYIDNHKLHCTNCDTTDYDIYRFCLKCNKHLLFAHKHCPKCDSSPENHRLENYDIMWGDGDIYCNLCESYVRNWDRD